MKTRTAKRIARQHRFGWEPHSALWIASQRRLADHYAQNVDDLRKIIERTQTVHHWGQPHEITPRLVSKPLGNGRQLLVLVPLNTRPNYYVARIDARWSAGHFDSDDFIDNDLDNLYELIEDEYGRSDWTCEDCGEDGYVFESECQCQEERDFPALNLGAGCAWEPIAWPGGA